MMKKKTALVTGSTSGIGLAIAQTLAESGCNILLNGFGEQSEIDAIAESIRFDFGVDVLYSNADMSKPDEIRKMVHECCAHFSSIDILVNNAGIQHTDAIETFPKERWDQIIAVNLSSNFHTIQAALPIMRQQNSGRIVNISSVHGQVASINKAAYVAAKHGVLGLTKVVALETAGTPITCNAICPGWVRTPLAQKQIDALAKREGICEAEAIKQMLGEKQPSKTFVTARQVGQAVMYLCSDAASEMRGSTLDINGGWLAQ